MKQTKKISTKQLALAGMLTAVIVVLSQIAIPMPVGVPITMQTFAIAVCGYILGWKLGLLSTCTYIIMGLAGLPVFANLSGGVGVLFGMTGGFIFGFVFMTLLCGIPVKNVALRIALGLAGLSICHFLGVIQFSVVTSKPFIQSFALVSLPYILKDVLSVVAAYFVAIVVKKALQSSNLMTHAQN